MNVEREELEFASGRSLMTIAKGGKLRQGQQQEKL